MAAVRPPVQMASAGKSIVIVQGGFLFTLPRTFNSSVTLRGTQGFRFDPSLGHGSFPAAQCGESQTACLPGTTVSVLGLWNGLDVLGTVVWRGKTFPSPGINSGGVIVMITGQFVAPPQADAATVTFPFTLTGFVQPEDNGVSLPFEGHGIATVHLVWDLTLGPGGQWALHDSRYEFNGAHSS